MNSCYEYEELSKIGLKSIGKNVLISKKVSIYGAEKISIGNHVRIDDFCVLSGKLNIHDYIHISAFCGLFSGDAGIELENYTTISSRCMIYAISDDYSGNAMTNPMIPERYRNVTCKEVIVRSHSIVGTSSVILPGVILAEGTAVGAMSLVNQSTQSWGIYAGIPVERIKERSIKLLDNDFLKYKEG